MATRQGRTASRWQQRGEDHRHVKHRFGPAAAPRVPQEPVEGRPAAPTPGSPSRHAAFTLIELLIVMAILAILAAMLFPVFAAARERARIITCASNERQLGLAIHMYAQDYDEQLPVEPHFYNPHGRLMVALAPYTRSVGLFYCPSAAGVTGLGDTPANRVAGNIAYHYWAYAEFQPGPPWPRWLPAGPRRLTLQDDSQAWLLTDYFDADNPTAHRLDNKSMNILRLDGHIQFILQNPRPLFR